jgi:nucleotide-binding universal stress UspA family protein
VIRPFLFATDFGQASMQALPFAISSANHFGTKLILLHIIPEVLVPEGSRWYTAGDIIKMREDARMTSLRQLEELTPSYQDLVVEPERIVEFQSSSSVSETILQTAENLKVDAIIMGLNRSAHIGTASHMPWATAYEVVCRASCPVLTVRS